MFKLPRPHKVIFDSGATLLYQRNPFSPTIAFGVWITRGSRDENDTERGLSHFLEHMVFRGTKKRNALQTALALESIGGQWDAFTSKESAAYHAKVLDEHFGTLVHVFSDILLHPSLDEDTFYLERKVVQEEIRSVKDSPEESVHELFFETLFQGHPLGHPVTGYYRDVSRYSRGDLLTFHRKTYTSENTLIGFVGNIPVHKVTSILERSFRFPRKRSVSRSPITEIKSGRVKSKRRSEWSQSHVCIGSRTVSASSPERYAVIILSNILGGGISSRLFQSLREQLGLVYSVFTHSSFWTDTGSLHTFFSVDPKNLPVAMEIFHKELSEIRAGKVRDEEIESAQAQVKGSVIFGMESVDARLFRLVQSECYHRRYVSPEEVVRAIEHVDRKKITEVAQRYLARDRLTYVSCGPVTLRGLRLSEA